jgi:hexosaminidase
VFLFFTSYLSAQNNPEDSINIIPKPLFAKINQGHFVIDKKTKIVSRRFSKDEKHIAEFLSGSIKNFTGLNIQIGSYQKKIGGKVIIFKKVEIDSLGEEGYQLLTNKNNIIIEANSGRGLFYGVQSLLQLIPPEDFTNSKIMDKKILVPCLEIKDKPEYKYRGMHLDVSRHFFPKEFIKKYIDLIAMYKFNYFHWHLTDDNGWRIEIKKYPLLTKISAWRVNREKQPWNNWSPIQPGEKATYGGYYTQDDIREIVKYAQERYITIIPEIEMPAHSSEVFAAYPQYSCTGDTLPVRPGGYWPNVDIFCAGNDSTFTFLENILSEVCDLFPGPYIHIGGDEADKTNWEKCPKCQARIKKEGLKDVEELQSYFMRRIEKFLVSKHKRMIGWDEILEGGLAPEATVMSWRGIEGGINAAKMGHEVIMTPTSNCYFDYYQANPEFEPEAIGGFTTLKKVYSFDPTPPGLTSAESKYILGAQGNLWSEYIKTPEYAEYMILPRMLALAEDVWTPESEKNWNDFLYRVNQHYKRFDAMKLNYSHGYFGVDFSTIYDKNLNRFLVSFNTEQLNPVIHYTLNGTDPDSTSLIYTKPFFVDSTTTIKAGIFSSNKLVRNISQQTIYIHKGIGKKIIYVDSPSPKYQGTGNTTLLDGICGSGNFSDGKWQGFEGNNFNVIIDLGKPVDVSNVSIDFLQNVTSWIFMPRYVEVSISPDGIKYKPFIIQNEISERTDTAVVKQFKAYFNKSEVEFIHIKAINIGVCPPWHPGAGGKAWLFCDEIIIQ